MPYAKSQKRKDCLKRFYEKRRRNGLCKRCGSPLSEAKLFCGACRQKLSDANSARLQSLRKQVIAGYGNKCACCGESNYEFLSIDHKEYRACEERKKFGRCLSTTELCHKILRENFPDMFQILCHNCNMALGIWGYCPHRPEIRRPRGHQKG